mgnify:CR=1 FL=1
MFYYVSMSSRGARPSDMSGSLSPAPNTASIIFILHAPCQHQVMFSIFFRQICLAPMDRSAPNALPPQNNRRSCEITILSFSRSICRGELAALIGVTGKPYPSCLSCHSHPIRPCGHLPLEGKAAIREYHLLKKGSEAATSTLNPEP